MNKFKILLLILAVIAGNRVFATDNVLQAIQVNGVKDSYNIVLKSDDVAELKKTVQAPNKMILTLKGLRASKTINTIYNNTSSVDSVVVEPTGEDSVKILIQADNVANAGIHFDTLKTPLGVLDKSQPKQATDEVVLSDPVSSYRPVYNDNEEEDVSGFSLSTGLAGTKDLLKNILQDEKLSWMVTLGLMAIFILKGIKTIRPKDSEIRIGLSQSLKDREIEMYKNAHLENLRHETPEPAAPISSVNYGLRAYQNDSRNPYLSPERQRATRTMSAPPVMNAQSIVNGLNQTAVKQQSLMQNTIQNTGLKTALKTETMTQPRTTNIDSIKFLESMTKIYEKNGRKDLAQGLKANMKKAKGSLV